MILDEEDEELVFKRIFELQNKSFHKRIEDRLRKLAKMYEVKYKINILK